MLSLVARHLSMRWIAVVAVLMLLASQIVMGWIHDTALRARIALAAAIISTAIDAVAVMYCYGDKVMKCALRRK